MDDYGYDLDGEEAEVEQSSSILALLADVEVVLEDASLDGNEVVNRKTGECVPLRE